MNTSVYLPLPLLLLSFVSTALMQRISTGQVMPKKFPLLVYCQSAVLNSRVQGHTSKVTQAYVMRPVVLVFLWLLLSRCQREVMY